MAIGFTTKVADPATLPSSIGVAVAFSPDGNYVAVGTQQTPYLHVYEWFGTSFGAKSANPSTLPLASINSVAWSPDSAFIGVSQNNSTNTMSVYPFSNGTIGSRIPNPSTMPTGGLAGGIKWSHSGNYLAITTSSSHPFIHVYEWSGGFGAKVANPTSLSTIQASSVAWSPSDDYIAVGGNFTPRQAVWPFNGTFGTKVANPATLPSSGIFAAHWSPDGNYLGFSTNSLSVPFQIYGWSGSAFGSLVADPATLPIHRVRHFNWSPDGNYIAASVQGNTVWVWEWSAGFGSVVANPADLPLSGNTPSVGSQNSINFGHFSPYSIAVAHNNAPIITAYEGGTAPVAGQPYIKRFGGVQHSARISGGVW